ncbi:MAG: uridine diphosphate-N-acetylglucosamine-binding protein YvcK [Propionibacteriales bacterium]|nr:uridine diphosphate-N-acetylglucosamine-binding protein YvcK [Propionibacteriales bacterium]
MNWSHETNVVALGGGHGLAASLSALRRVTSELTAIVTVADNGGSSGRLRQEFGVLPPGDLRMALAALCGDDRWGQTWAKVLQHRFDSDGDMDGHAVGNLLIVALWELLDDHVSGLDWVGGLLGARGRVLPMALTPLDIAAEVRGVDPADPDGITVVRGQVEVATTAGQVVDVRLEPGDPTACPEAVRAIGEADWVVLGPGSWYSSVIPHVLVPGLRTALAATPGRVLVTLNLEAQPGETEGFTPEDHLAVLRRHAPDLRIDTVLADSGSVVHESRLRSAASDLGARLVLADVAAAGASGQHDPEKLARAYALVLGAN